MTAAIVAALITGGLALAGTVISVLASSHKTEQWDIQSPNKLTGKIKNARTAKKAAKCRKTIIQTTSAATERNKRDNNSNIERYIKCQKNSMKKMI